MTREEFDENRRTLEKIINNYRVNLDLATNLLKKLQSDYWIGFADDNWSAYIGKTVRFHSTSWTGEPIVSGPGILVRFDWIDKVNHAGVYPLMEESKPFGDGKSRFAVEYITRIEEVEL